MFIVSGAGCRVSADTKSWRTSSALGEPLIAGHAHPTIQAYSEEQARKGTTVRHATRRSKWISPRGSRPLPSGWEMVRFVSLTSGTGRDERALQLARAPPAARVLKFAGCYHGHSDGLLKAGSGVARSGCQSAGVPESIHARHADGAPTTILLTRRTAARVTPLAAIIVEAYAGNMGCVCPGRGLSRGCGRSRRRNRRAFSQLFTDEVITGFSCGPAGAQGRAGVRPDLTYWASDRRQHRSRRTAARAR